MKIIIMDISPTPCEICKDAVSTVRLQVKNSFSRSFYQQFRCDACLDKLIETRQGAGMLTEIEDMR